jgi:hypothetical protein
VSRANIPPDVLRTHENHVNTPDISGRNFQVLICETPEIWDSFYLMDPESVTKNAWIMRDEFFRLEPDPEWDLSVQRFLNKWGLWVSERGFHDKWDGNSISNLRLLQELASGRKINKPNFVMVHPHQLRWWQKHYRKSLLDRNASNWLSLHPLHLETAKDPPFFRVLRRYCTTAIEATITIDHLAGRKHGICKRCHALFEKETKHKKNFCSDRCINAAGVQRWREKQRSATKKGAKRNAKG